VSYKEESSGLEEFLLEKCAELEGRMASGRQQLEEAMR